MDQRPSYRPEVACPRAELANTAGNVGSESEAPAKNHRGIWSTSFISPVGKQRLKRVEAGLLRLCPVLSSLSTRALHFLSFHNLERHTSESCLLLYQPRNHLTKGALPWISVPPLYLQDAIIIPTQESVSSVFCLFLFFCFLWVFLAAPSAACEISVPQTGMEATPKAHLL